MPNFLSKQYFPKFSGNPDGCYNTSIEYIISYMLPPPQHYPEGVLPMTNKSCFNCHIGIKIGINDDILCKYKGVVSPNYRCSRHKTAVEAEPESYKRYKCIECEYFTLKNAAKNINSKLGLCSLFSVRYFDGSMKNACSKFSRRAAQGVS